MKLSDRGVALIAGFEGFRSHPYQDAVGVWTIGYGSTKGIGPNTPPITQGAALARLKREVDQTYGAAVNALRLPLSQGQFDALVSFVYNVGPGALAPSTGIGRALRRRAWNTAANELLKWDKAGGRRLEGLTRRRRAERALFLTRTRPSGPAAWLTHKELAAVREYDTLAHRTHRSQMDTRRLEKLRAQLVVMRKRIWSAAQEPGGWDVRHRRQRYQSLLARTH